MECGIDMQIYNSYYEMCLPQSLYTDESPLCAKHTILTLLNLMKTMLVGIIVAPEINFYERSFCPQDRHYA